MKRSLLVACVSVLGILTSFTGCQASDSVCGRLPDGGKGDPDYLQPNAQACPDRASLGFAQEFGSGTYIGTSVPDILIIKNGGIADLNITSATFTGDPEFTFAAEPEVPATIKGNKHVLMRFFFAPKLAKLYTGKFTVQSNGENSPSLEFEISGCGVPSDGGTSPCYRDGGM